MLDAIYWIGTIIIKESVYNISTFFVSLIQSLLSSAEQQEQHLEFSTTVPFCYIDISCILLLHTC
jgi:hypothetical protein